MNRRDRFFQAARVKTELVPLVVDGEPLEVEVHGISVGARGKLLTECVTLVPDDEGDMESRTDMSKLQPALVIAATFDPDTKQPLFTDADRDAIGDMAASFIDPIIEVAMRLGGFGKKVMEQAEGNSEKTPS